MCKRSRYIGAQQGAQCSQYLSGLRSGRCRSLIGSSAPGQNPRGSGIGTQLKVRFLVQVRTYKINATLSIVRNTSFKGEHLQGSRKVNWSRGNLVGETCAESEQEIYRGELDAIYIPQDPTE